MRHVLLVAVAVAACSPPPVAPPAADPSPSVTTAPPATAGAEAPKPAATATATAEAPKPAEPAPRWTMRSTLPWKVGQTVDVELTVVPSDPNELACASSTAVGDNHCGFEQRDKPWTKPPASDDKVLRPYTTTDRHPFVASGLWSDPAFAADKLPRKRIKVKCKLEVQGTLDDHFVRWETEGRWFPGNTIWYAGSLSGCKAQP